MVDLIFWFSLLTIFFSLLSFIFTFIAFYRYRKLARTKQNGKPSNLDSSYEPTPTVKHSVSEVVDNNNNKNEARQPNQTDPTRFTRSLLLEILPSDSAKWASLFEGKGCDDLNRETTATDEGDIGKKKKRKAKKKKASSQAEDEKANTGSDSGRILESVCAYPFTSSSSLMQRKIKQQYDELVKCHKSKKLTLPMVVQFANCLADARTELQQKADTIKRKFVVTKALLFKADRSSFDRLQQQIYKLELEQKRLEEDAFVYNWLQQQLKLSPAYKKMLEIASHMEKEKSFKLREDEDSEFSDITFEELLEQEKKDSFWQKTAKSRQCSS